MRDVRKLYAAQSRWSLKHELQHVKVESKTQGAITSTIEIRSGKDETSKEATIITMKKIVLKALFRVSALPFPDPIALLEADTVRTVRNTKPLKEHREGIRSAQICFCLFN